ncbi:Cysteine-rich venom protein like [Senna tora]|uniref:Cysteine-rich venom protein like n=1 Tax=Senna tora TaxID=362788 RepID=A0A834SU13_9FABA|nr:Cysteine-rich venom protein like [Senna tora]
MHRQSLGSPASKLHIHGGANDDDTHEPKRHINFEDDDDNNNIKALKTHRLSLSPSPTTQKFIHLIPIFTLLCFLVLYVFSHNPSQSDLAQFNGFKKRYSPHFDSAAEMNGIQQYMEAEKGDILAIGRLRNLREIPKSRVHRKFGDF